MPRTLLLAIPGEGGTTVRYAWRISTGSHPGTRTVTRAFTGQDRPEGQG